MSNKKSHSENLDIFDNILSDLLLRELVRRNINQRELADILEITPSYLSEILNKKKAGQRLGFKFLYNLKLIVSENHEQKNNFMCGWPEETIKACNDLKKILDDGEEEERKDVLSAIRQAKKIKELKNSNAGRSSGSRQNRITKKKAM
jgi:transcriptional regulator with XRE-family HTH domain